MTRETAKTLLEKGIFQAYAEGKTIQIRPKASGGINEFTWGYFGDSPIEFSDSYEYRIKPEPRHFWIRIYSDGSKSVYNDAKSGREAFTCGTFELVEVIEVLK